LGRSFPKKDIKKKKRNKRKKVKFASLDDIPLSQVENLYTWKRQAKLEFAEREIKSGKSHDYGALVKVARLVFCAKKANKKGFQELLKFLFWEIEEVLQHRLGTLVCAHKFGWTAANLYAKGAGDDRIARKEAKNFKRCVSLAAKIKYQNPKRLQGGGRQRDSLNNTQTPQPVVRKCYKCGKPGHIRANCPDRQTQAQNPE